MPLEFVSSEKGKRKLLVDGHLFYKDKQRNDKVYWKCERFQYMKCGARIITAGSDIVSDRNEHNHVGEAVSVEAKKVLANLREMAKNTRDTPNYIVSTAAAQASPGAAAQLPSVSNMKRTIRNVRVKENAGQAVPLFRRDIVFPEEYKKTEKGENFLMFDSGPRDDRILIYSTQRNLQLLGRSDGTFKTVPPLFEQLYTIHGFEKNNSIHLWFGLLGDKKEETYVRFLEKVKDLIPENPVTVMTDFEMSMINAVKTVYPQSVHQGCFFHFCQCIWRKIQGNGLKQRYETDADFALKMRLLPALALVPRETVVDAFNYLRDSNVFPQESQPVIDYFEDTWIGRPGRRRRPPMFAHEMWNCFDTVLRGLPKTNNNVEGWHRGFQHLISASHPNIWRFISGMKKEQSLNELRIEQYCSGQEPPRQRRKYRDSAERLRRVVGEWENNADIGTYLRGVAHNLGF